MARDDKRKPNAKSNNASGETVELFREEKALNEEDEKADAAKSGEMPDAAADKTEAESEANEANTEASANEANPAEGAETEAEAAAEEGAKEDDKSASDDPKKKDAKKDKRDEKIAELNDKVLRQQAEFINFRNRTEKEKAQMFEVGAKSAFEKILPVIDNFERGLATLTDEEREQPFASGIDKTYRQLMTVLTEAGVTPIEAVGQPFDPDLHNAVMHVEDDSVGENIVVEEFQKGYKYRDSVLRHSMVKVAN